MQIAIILITVTLPIAWLVAEFRARAVVRRILGVITILWSFGIASLTGKLLELNANIHFARASKELLGASVEHLRAGKSDSVLRELTRANDEFNPGYGNRARYKEIVDQALEGMKK